ncbi:endonuclease [Candidatus Halobeggiatoa sp. HSG11]|nr:endonuclease [Candidatus Halobeggiatoa sp. HSG11]
MRGLGKWHWKAIKRNVLKFLELRKQGRYTDATHVLKIYKGAAFWIIVPLYAVLWLVGSPQSRTPQPTQPPISTIPSEPTTAGSREPTRNWDYVKRQANTRHKVRTFKKAKKALYPIYKQLRLEKTFYCNCQYRNKKPNLSSCGVRPKKDVKRMNRLEAEHVVPASLVGNTMSCWKRGGRKNCSRNNKAFQLVEGDLHNLVPALGEVNGNRSNYPPVENIRGESREYGNCDVEISRKKFEPPPDKRGDIARAYLYMWKVYDAPLTRKEIKMFKLWNWNDKPTQEEIAIHEAKAEVQGNRNPYY